MQTEYEVCDMKFQRTEFTGLDGGKIVTYSEDTGSLTPFQVRISKEGMKFKGEMEGAVSSESDIQDLARFMSDWVQDVRKLRPRISLSPKEQVDPVV